MKQEEIWRPIEGYEGLYEVSNLGKVRSLERIDYSGHLRNGRILRPAVVRGYLQVSLSKEGKRKMFYVHRLVAQAFITNPEGLPEINHRDENPKNNRADNLEWCDSTYNKRYGSRNERMIQTRIKNGNADPDTCFIQAKDKKEYNRIYMRIYRHKKKQEKKDNRPSEPSLF